MPQFHKFITPALSALALFFAVATPILACGPDFPNAYLAEGSASLLQAPEGYFADEIIKLATTQKPAGLASQSASTETLIAAANAAKRANELTETGVLRIELAKRGLAPARIDALAAELETARAAIFSKNWNTPAIFSPDMPAEFALYLAGASAYWQNDFDKAREYWITLLALPAAERQHYSVNAAYMIGRIFTPDAKPDRNYYLNEEKQTMRESPEWFVKTRQLAASGFDDLSDLATASYGWEARACFINDDPAKAIHLYLQQIAHGDTHIDITSLRIVAQNALDSCKWQNTSLDADTTQRLTKLAQDEQSRRVLTLFLLARFGGGGWGLAGEQTEKHILNQTRAWAEILEHARLRNIPDTDRLAWIAYQAGYYELAQKWASLAPQDSVPANWIRAKLALRAGNLLNAETLLEKVTSSNDLAGEARPAAWSELGRVRMSRSEYTTALDSFVRGGHWEDSAYIAERVLTLDELRNYVDQTCSNYSTNPPSEPDRYFFQTETAARNNLRHLLARRLARANQPDESAKYFSKELRKDYKAYIAGVRTGFDTDPPAKKRARAYWRAARIIREKGMELLGTELAPDYFIWEGCYEYGEIPQARKTRLRLEGGPAAPTDDELKRLKQTPMPEQRYHYRYRAAELGMWAASLLPNDTDETADILNRSGTWLKNRDPKAANEFYRALIIRCGNTTLGKAAAAKGWFPD